MNRREEAAVQKRLGVLGGMGPQATQLFFQRVVMRTQACCDQEHVPMLVLNDTGMPDRTQAILSGNEDQVYSRLLAGAKLLERCGCSVIAIPCNTSHYFADRLQEQLTVPLINMVMETVTALAAAGIKRPGILATDGTVQTGVYQRACEQAGLEGRIPPPAIQKLVMSIIYDDIKSGKLGDTEKFFQIDKTLREMGCDAGVLACTELSCYRVWNGLSPYYLDPMEILAEKSILMCGGKLKAQC